MGFLSDFFGNQQHWFESASSKKRSSLNHRVCRIEEMESREMLSATPYEAPDPINIGVVYHEDCVQSDTEQLEDAGGDTFIVSWTGGAAGTTLDRIVIDLTQNATGGPNSSLHFNVDGKKFPNGYENSFQDFLYASLVENHDNGITATHTLSEDGKTLIIDFTGFTSDKTFYFKIDVDEFTGGAETGIDRNVSGKEIEGARITTFFSAENYESSETTFNMQDRYFVTPGVNVPTEQNYNGNGADTVNTAGAMGQTPVQTPLKGSISGYVYEDVNNDGIKGINEKGIPNVELELFYLDENGVYKSTNRLAKTDSDGRYEFNDIPGGQTYMIREVAQPDGYSDGKDTPGKINGIDDTVAETFSPDTISTIHIGANEHGTEYNFGELKRAELSGYVYNDRNNNGIREQGEEGIGGVTIILQVLNSQGVYENVEGAIVKTDPNGRYEFTNLDPFRTYRVIEEQPEGWIDGKESVGTLGGDASENDRISGILPKFGESGLEYNFGEYKYGSISGNVYEDKNNNGTKDPGETGLDDVTVYLCVVDEFGNKHTIDSTKTTDGGKYIFDQLEPGKTYCVTQENPEEYCSTGSSPGTIGGNQVGTVNVDVAPGFDQIHDIYIGSGDHGINYNFGEALRGSLSGYVYLDTNEDGKMNAGEKGIEGVVITLWVWNGTEYVQTNRTATTGPNGEYTFEGLCPFRKYMVTESQPEDYLDGNETVGTIDSKPVGNLVGNDQIGGIDLTPGGIGEGYNFGEREKPLEPEKGSLSGHVYIDQNENGKRDAGEKGIGGVLITLWVKDGDTYRQLKSIRTEADGSYSFADLDPNKIYKITQTQPEDYLDANETIGSLGGEQNVNDQIENILLQPGQHGINYNFGEREIPVEPEKGSLSGYVYIDENENGKRDTGEKGIAGVTITLWVKDGDSYRKVKSIRTETDGSYSFSNLDPNKTYKITQTQPEDYLDADETIGSLGGEQFVNDQIENILLQPGQHGVNYNFGELEKPIQPESGSISGYVYVDANENGIRDSSEQGIANVTITLWKKVNGEYVKIDSTTTNYKGEYSFSDLDPNEIYMVTQTQPTAYDDGEEEIGSLGGNATVNDQISEILLGSGDRGTGYNFGELEKPVQPENGSISGYVYLDENENGKRDAGEAAIEGVIITLWKKVDGEYIATGLTAVTGEDGAYTFSNLEPDAVYMVVETQPDFYRDGEEEVGSLGGLNSSDDVISEIHLKSGEHGTNYNFGERELPDNNQDDDPTSPPPPGTVVFPVVTPPYYTPLGGAGAGAGMSPNWTLPNFGPGLVAGYGAGGVASGYSWHLSVINGGYPRDIASLEAAASGIYAANAATRSAMILDGNENADEKTKYVSVAWTPLPMDQAVWYVRESDGTVKKRFAFGPKGGKALAADFNGDGIANLAVFHEGNWYVDLNGNGVWDEEDLRCEMGTAADQPIVGDWDGDGKADIGVFGPQWDGDQTLVMDEPGLPSDLNSTVTTRPKNMPPEVSIRAVADQTRAMKHSRTGQVRLDVVDHVFQYGGEGDQAFTGDFSGDGISKVGIYRNGNWYIDYNGNGRWDNEDIYIENADRGLDARGIPVVGDFNGDGIDNIGLFVDGVWHLDTTGDFNFDTTIQFGQPGDSPVVGDFNGDGIDQLAVIRASYLDSQMTKSMPTQAPAVSVENAAPMYAADATQRSMNAEVSTTDQGTLPEQLQRHERTMTTPHTNVPLKK